MKTNITHAEEIDIINLHPKWLKAVFALSGTIFHLIPIVYSLILFPEATFLIGNLFGFLSALLVISIAYRILIKTRDQRTTIAVNLYFVLLTILIITIGIYIATFLNNNHFIPFYIQFLPSTAGWLFIAAALPKKELTFEKRTPRLLMKTDFLINSHVRIIPLETINHISFVITPPNKNKQTGLGSITLQFFQTRLPKENDKPLTEWQVFPLINIIPTFYKILLWCQASNVAVSLKGTLIHGKAQKILENVTTTNIENDFLDFRQHNPLDAIEEVIIRLKQQSLSSIQENPNIENEQNPLTLLKNHYTIHQPPKNSKIILQAKKRGSGSVLKKIVSLLLFILGIILTFAAINLLFVLIQKIISTGFINESLAKTEIYLLFLSPILLIVSLRNLIAAFLSVSSLTIDREKITYKLTFRNKIIQRLDLPKKALIKIKTSNNSIDLVFFGEKIINFWKGNRKEQLHALYSLKYTFQNT